MTNVASGTSIAVVANLHGDPARANMLYALTGKAQTAGEIACRVGYADDGLERLVQARWLIYCGFLGMAYKQ